MLKVFGPPTFPTDAENFRAKFINGFAWAVMILLFLGILPNLNQGGGPNYTAPVLGTLIAVMAVALYLLRKRNLRASAFVVVIFGWIGLGFQALTADGVRDVIVLAYVALALFASIVINWRAGAAVVLSSIAAVWLLAALEVTNVMAPHFQAPLEFARDLSLIFVAIAVLIYFSTTSLYSAVSRSGKTEASLRASNEALMELNQTLEERVFARTQALEQATRASERRARQFEAVAQVAHVISNVQVLESLLPRIAEVISEQFEHYHTGIFLTDAPGQYVVLRAANSPGGQKMLARLHKLAVSQSSIVGYVTSTGQPRIALDVGADAVYFDNPDLPDTHSEIALPLRISGTVIGALDVQSEEVNAFQPDDIAALSTLADQVAIAIQNTRTLEESRHALSEAQSAYGESTREAWKVMKPQSMALGLELVDSQIKPLERPLDPEVLQRAREDDRAAAGLDRKRNLVVPIRMRGHVIGVMNLKNKSQHLWTDDELDIAQAVAERLSLAIETAALLRSAQHRADIERITTDISTKIGSSARFDTIMQTAAQELSRALGGSDVVVQIEPVALKMGMSDS